MVKLVSSVENGMQFQCKRCGKCCSSSTEGCVFIFPPDIPNLLSYTKVTPEKFARNYIRIVKYVFHIWNAHLEDTGKRVILPTLVFNSENTADCLFLATQNGIKFCNIYQYRPFQCRAYPCWSIVLTANEESYDQHKSDCPGFTIDQKLSDPISIQTISRDEILKWIKEERQIERDYFLKMRDCDFNIYKMYPFLDKSFQGHQIPAEEE
jgi:Fe-S-cluster containining protein